MTEEEKEKARIIASMQKQSGVTTSNLSEETEIGLSATEKGKLFAQGLLFNFSDEAIAGTKSIFGDKTYEEYVNEERKVLNVAREKAPIEALGYEMGGAIVPALVAAPFTGGASIPATIGRIALTGSGKTALKMAGYGAAQGTIASVGSQDEVGFGNTLLAASTSAVVSPALQKTFQFFGTGLKKIVVDPILRKLQGASGKKVEDEIMRVITDSGLTADEIITAVKNGKIIPEISPQANETVRVIVNQMTPATPIIEQALQDRKGKFIVDVFQNLQKDLAPTVQGNVTAKSTNIFKDFSDNTDKLKQQKWETYQEVWKNQGGKYVSNATPDAKTYDSIGNGLLDIVGSSQSNGKLINEFFDVKGLPPILKLNKKGVWELTRSPTLYEGEKVKQAFMNASKRLEAGPAVKEQFVSLEKNIKNILDETSPELKNVRKNWAEVESSIKQFEFGRKLLSPKTDPEEFQVFFDKLLAQGNQLEIDALRQGVAQNLKKRLGQSIGRRSSTITALADDPLELDLVQNERKILEVLYQGMPNDKIESVLKNVDLATGSIKAVARIIGGSQSGKSIQGQKRLGLVPIATNMYRFFSYGDLDAGRNIIKSIGGDASQLPDDVMIKVGNILISEDAELIQRALTDQTARKVIIDKINRLTGIEGFNLGLSKGGAILSEKATSNVIDINPYENAFINIAKDMNKQTKQKVINAAQ
jgi:hypothetical protein